MVVTYTTFVRTLQPHPILEAWHSFCLADIGDETAAVRSVIQDLVVSRSVGSSRAHILQLPKYFRLLRLAPPYVLAADPPAHCFSLWSNASMLIFEFCLNSLLTAIMKYAVEL
jgi:hypothetical protein